jgi:tRNA A-37 threonylcarbamoyl transferase component Bud32
MTVTCPDPDRLTGFVEDSLAAEDRTTIEAHLDGCDDCRSLIAMLAQAATAEQEHERASARTLGTEVGPGFEATEVAPRIGRSSSPNLPPGTKIGRYEIHEPLGMGGMGVVYAARDPELRREVAIKVIRPELARAHPDATRRILREARAMARLSHPNVVSVYDVGTIGDQVFVAMERITGTNLREWLRAAPRSLAEIVDVFTDAGRGLVAAHDAGIVHRDFKPDNVLVGADGRARVTDFGLAYEVGDTDDRAVVGTPAYMAPEQLAGGHVDARTDQFGFAIALYEALYGERPFAASTREALAEAVQRGRIAPAPPRSAVPPSLRRIVVRALAVTPGERFATMHDLLAALGRDRGRRPRQLASVALVMFLLVGVAFGADAILRDRAREVTRTSFEAARVQLHKLVESRTETFMAQTDALYLLPAVRAVAQSLDFADFGLVDESEDRARRKTARDTLFSQSWLTATPLGRASVIAVADYKGRLLYTSANPDAWDNDITHVPVIAAAYDAGTEVYLGVMKGDDPQVVESKLLGPGPRAELFVVFARIKRVKDQPRALFVQFVEAKRVLEEVSTGTDTLLSVTAHGGVAEGSVPPPVIARAGDGAMTELAIESDEWIAQRSKLQGKHQSGAIAELVLARHTDVGLAGLFPYARHVLALASLLFAAVAVGGFLLVRRRRLPRKRS